MIPARRNNPQRRVTRRRARPGVAEPRGLRSAAPSHEPTRSLPQRPKCFSHAVPISFCRSRASRKTAASRALPPGTAARARPCRHPSVFVGTRSCAVAVRLPRRRRPETIVLGQKLPHVMESNDHRVPSRRSRAVWSLVAVILRTKPSCPVDISSASQRSSHHRPLLCELVRSSVGGLGDAICFVRRHAGSRRGPRGHP